MIEFHKIWIEQCEAAKGIEAEFGTDKALDYLIGDKFINFLEAAEDNAAFRAEIPAFVAEIRKIFEPWQLKECLERTRVSEPFERTVYEDEDPEEVEDAWHYDVRRSAADLCLVERAKEWLLEEEAT